MTDTTTIAPTATSRLHAGVIALAGWDHRTLEGEDMTDLEVRPEHWTGAEEVWDAITPKLDTVEALLDLEPSSVVYATDRNGVTLYRRLGTLRGEFRPLIAANEVAGNSSGGASAVRARHLLVRHGSVRLLWAPQ
jgi:hypothetical protein